MQSNPIRVDAYFPWLLHEAVDGTCRIGGIPREKLAEMVGLKRSTIDNAVAKPGTYRTRLMHIGLEPVARILMEARYRNVLTDEGVRDVIWSWICRDVCSRESARVVLVVLAQSGLPGVVDSVVMRRLDPILKALPQGSQKADLSRFMHWLWPRADPSHRDDPCDSKTADVGTGGQNGSLKLRVR